MYEIIDGLHLASFDDVKRIGKNSRNYFIVNCSRDLPMRSPNGRRVPIDDAPHENSRMLGFFEPVTRLIHEQLQQGDVIVHCWAGQQRSAAMVAAYIMRYGPASKDDAMELVKLRKSDAFSWGATFSPALTNWENMRV
jgi:hypothetical protein